MNIKDAYFIYQHMGLGDHLICNGLVRKLIQTDRQYFMFVKPHNVGSVSYMYRDIKNLAFIQCDDAGAVGFINDYRVADRLHLIGFNWVDTKRSFEENFYLQHGLEFNEKWDLFRCDRDIAAEKMITDHYSIDGDYIFVHDDDRFHIDKTRLPSDIQIVRPKIGLSDNIFSYAHLIQNAKEVHCIESSFAFMIDLLRLNRRFYIHRYARPLAGYDAVDLFGKYNHVEEILI